MGLRRLLARPDGNLYLTEAAREREAHGRAPEEPAHTERAADALSRSSAEPLALEQARAPREAAARLLIRQHEQLDRVRTRAEERLAASQHELKHLGWRTRDRRVELQAEIALQETALHLADEKLAELATVRIPDPPRMPREGRAPERARLLQIAGERETPGIALDR